MRVADRLVAEHDDAASPSSARRVGRARAVVEEAELAEQRALLEHRDERLAPVGRRVSDRDPPVRRCRTARRRRRPGGRAPRCGRPCGSSHCSRSVSSVVGRQRAEELRWSRGAVVPACVPAERSHARLARSVSQSAGPGGRGCGASGILALRPISGPSRGPSPAGLLHVARSSHAVRRRRQGRLPAPRCGDHREREKKEAFGGEDATTSCCASPTATSRSWSRPTTPRRSASARSSTTKRSRRCSRSFARRRRACPPTGRAGSRTTSRS